jgi:hypothetical protein
MCRALQTGTSLRRRRRLSTRHDPGTLQFFPFMSSSIVAMPFSYRPSRQSISAPRRMKLRLPSVSSPRLDP